MLGSKGPHVLPGKMLLHHDLGNQGLKSAANSKLRAMCLSPVFIQATLNNILLGVDVTEIVQTHQTPKKYIKLPLCFQI